MGREKWVAPGSEQGPDGLEVGVSGGWEEWVMPTRETSI